MLASAAAAALMIPIAPAMAATAPSHGFVASGIH